MPIAAQLRAVDLRPPGASKVPPQITGSFWVAKLLTTAMGEATSDALVHRIDPYLAVSLGAIGLVTALTIQLAVRSYITWVYWLTAATVAVTGTMAADVLHVALGVPYVVSAPFFGIALAIVFAAWYATERTLSIHSIRTLRRELFYWAAVMATFALGTAAGDLTAYTANLGFLVSVGIFAVLFALPGLAHWRLGLNPVFAFWSAYVMTRPLGASVADWVAKPHVLGGLGAGDGGVSVVLTLLMAVFIGWMALRGEDRRG